MSTIKDISIEVIKNLPETSSVEDIMYQLNLVSQVMYGLQDEANGKTKTTSEVLEAIVKWQTK